MVNTAEVVDVLSRLGKLEPEAIRHQLHFLELGGVVIHLPESDTGLLAGQLRATHYQRSTCAISLADCFALASALIVGEPLATADSALANAAIAAGAKVIGLPNSAGKRPPILG